MDGRERSALAHAAGAAVARVTRAAGGTHAAVVDVVRSATSGLGPIASLSVEAADLSSRATYALVAGAARATSRAAAPALARSADPAAPPACLDPEAVAWLAVLGAAHGDRLIADVDMRALTVPMGLRDRGLPVDPADPTAVPDPRATVVVLVHGLGGHESQWGPGYLGVVHGAGATPLTVRYTTGQPIADSGAELARLLDQLAETWPVPVARLVLVGHSMGGLVIREALAARSGPGRRRVSDVVTLGTPHAGAPLERGARRAIAAVSALPLAAPIAALGDERSRGIKDLAFADVAAPTPGPAWHLVAASVAPAGTVRFAQGAAGDRPDPLLGWVGDGLVPLASALAVPDELVASRVHIPGAGHLALLDHPTVTEVLRGVVSGG